MRPRGRPPTPSATSRAIDPVGMTSTGARSSLPRRMTEPLPNWRSIWASAVSRAFSRSVGDGIAVVSLSRRCAGGRCTRWLPIGCRRLARPTGLAVFPARRTRQYEWPPTSRSRRCCACEDGGAGGTWGGGYAGSNTSSSDTPPGPSGARSAILRHETAPMPTLARHVVGAAEREPDRRGRLALGEGTLGGAAAELVQGEVTGQDPALRLAELLVDGAPELADLHSGRTGVSAPRGRDEGAGQERSPHRSPRAARRARRVSRAPRADPRPRA